MINATFRPQSEPQKTEDKRNHRRKIAQKIPQTKNHRSCNGQRHQDPLNTSSKHDKGQSKRIRETYNPQLTVNTFLGTLTSQENLLTNRQPLRLAIGNRLRRSCNQKLVIVSVIQALDKSRS